MNISPQSICWFQTSSSNLCWYHTFTALQYGLQGEAVVSCWSVRSIINHLLSHSNLQNSQQHPKKSCMLWQEWFPLKKYFLFFESYSYLLVFPSFPLSLPMYFFVFLVLLPDKNSFALTLASFLLKICYLQEWRERPMTVKLRHQYTENPNVFRVDFYLWYRKTGNQNAQFKINTCSVSMHTRELTNANPFSWAP